MAILALEFSTQQHGIALLPKDGDATTVVRQSTSSTGRREIPAAALINEALEKTGLQRNDIDLLAIGLGPGSYTGIRVAIALAQGWELAGEGRVQVVGIPSLDVLVHTLFRSGERGSVTLAFDAQKSELHLSTHDLGAPPEQWEASLKNPSWRTLSNSQWKMLLDRGETMVGSDLESWDARIRNIYPCPAVLAKLAAAWRDSGGTTVPGTIWSPVYLREVQFVKVSPPLTPLP